MSRVGHIFCILMLFWHSAEVYAQEFDAKRFADGYFKAWQASQAVGASADDIEQYLSYLTDDVGHQHLPYDPDATRNADGKAAMRDGMSYYLGVHVEYRSELVNTMLGYDVIVLKYSTYAKGKHPQTGEINIQNYDTVEVLEIENGKVAIIRKYSE